MSGWFGVDLDGTLAFYDKFISPTHIGEPIPAMVERVKRWLVEGRDVRIFTARVSPGAAVSLETDWEVVCAIQQWCLSHLGRVLPITCAKDQHLIELWDDRCVQVEKNTGRPIRSCKCECGG